MSAYLLPTLFVSNGAPTLPLENVPAREFLTTLGDRYRNAQAVLCISAHWNTLQPTVSAVEAPETIHDFYGFPAELYELRYNARGSPDLAGRVADLLHEVGLRCDLDDHRGLDHGAWVPLMLMFPIAKVPVVQLSIQQHLDPAQHVALGAALSSLRDKGVLVVGSAAAVHPLGYPPGHRYAKVGLIIPIFYHTLIGSPDCSPHQAAMPNAQRRSSCEPILAL